jgi:predicted ferric reductase
MKRLLQIIFPIIEIAVLVFVWSVSIRNNGGWQGTFIPDEHELTYNLIRLAGLTAFTLLSFQVITGTFMHLFNKVYGERFYFFHSYSGIFVLAFALTHFGLIHLYMSFYHYGILSFSALYPRPYIDFGPVGLGLLGITVPTAILAVLILHQKPKKWWRYFHYANYLVFLLIFFHSINIGTDLNTDNTLHPLWYVFFVLFVLGILYKRIFRVWQKKRAAETSLQS